MFWACQNEQKQGSRLDEAIPQKTDSSATPQSRLPQKTKIWQDLMSVEYLLKGAQGNEPTFTQTQAQYEGKRLQLQGYMYPIEQQKIQNFFMLTYFPTDACFFCGGAGPESVVEVNSPKGIKLSTKLITIEGRLELNRDDPQRLFYQLQEAKQIK